MLRSLHLEKRDNKYIIIYSALVGLATGRLAFGLIPLGCGIGGLYQNVKESVSSRDTRVLCI